MRICIILLSAAFTIAATLPYMVQIHRRAAKPRLSSWGIWTAAQVIGSAAAFTDHQLPSALYVGFCAVECAIVTVLGWRYGDRSLDALDYVCLVSASVGLVLLVLVKAPGPAVLVSILTDFLAYIPTIKHSWYKPHEETWLTYALFGLGSVLVLLISNLQLTAVAYPLYLVVFDTGVAAIILASPHRRDAGRMVAGAGTNDTAQLSKITDHTP